MAKRGNRMQHRGLRLRQLLGLGGIVSLVPLALPVLALTESVGSQGIDARRLHDAPYSLTGDKIAIGQVEIGRPSQFGLDKVASETLPVVVRRVLVLDGWARADEYVDGHAANVASVMISQDKLRTGVAPEALLYSGAVGRLSDRSAQPEECLAAQSVALQNGGDVRAINFSFGEPLGRDPRPNPVLDGNALLTQCIDWSSRTHGALYVIAGNQGSGGIPIPTDNFNGLNIAYSRQVNGEFNKIDFSNLGSEPTVQSRRATAPETNVGPRRSITLVAPGSDIELIDPDGQVRRSSGTSFASPHVVGTIALMQQFVDRQFRSGAANWPLTGRHPMVMKAVLLNSADKIKDNGDGLRLGMSRTLVDDANRSWLESDAYRDPKIPLHSDLGTGHLNAYRAYQQLAPGATGPDQAIPAIGWNFAELEAQPATVHDYEFAEALQAGSFLSATLAWERVVDLVDANRNGLYDLGEGFNDQGLNNLDVYLMPADEDDIANSLWSSVSEVDSVEHIFYQIPETGRYKLRVIYQQRAHSEPTQPYALAWWSVPAP
ncbi:S8 family serine peptidase [Nodosilinea sp. PGN35]|uniref:S8 family serine peptidase n=1 Tax=Nodosilinea sp. PGN35 TaxID=3020489 RepID=UPI0023B21D48|nr:S8 family serine peptidase [Nodosilinea sp. TSF1-S3]MDF0367627.1 S8 family serine peptidase [Nodosilinea sp. TSF1-S3]